jgi:hypothetical protein
LRKRSVPASTGHALCGIDGVFLINPAFTRRAVWPHGRANRSAIDVGAVEAAHVDDAELATITPELGVAAADRDVVKDDVAVGMATRPSRILAWP